MSECLYHVFMVLAMAMAAVGAFYGIAFLHDKYHAFRKAMRGNEGFIILIPALGAIAAFFIMAQAVPKVITVTSCSDGKRMETVVVKNLGICKVKPS